ncbi:hypothetical protein SUGI_0766810 [Cryptomeria japonica]|nr:hypothetical protein SUGI_0766810 [Cryptomeria japonica]
MVGFLLSAKLNLPDTKFWCHKFCSASPPELCYRNYKLYLDSKMVTIVKRTGPTYLNSVEGMCTVKGKDSRGRSRKD